MLLQPLWESTCYVSRALFMTRGHPVIKPCAIRAVCERADTAIDRRREGLQILTERYVRLSLGVRPHKNPCAPLKTQNSPRLNSCLPPETCQTRVFWLSGCKRGKKGSSHLIGTTVRQRCLEHKQILRRLLTSRVGVLAVLAICQQTFGWCVYTDL